MAAMSGSTACSLAVWHFARARKRDDKPTLNSHRRQAHRIGRPGACAAVAFITASSVAADSQPAASLHLRAAGGLHAVRASRRLVVRDACNVGTPDGKTSHFAYNWHISHMRITLVRVF